MEVASKADAIILAVGANWNSDGEGGDRSTLGLSTNQTELADAIFSLGKPVILVLQGGRPFAIPEYYSRAAAVINAFFPGPSGGQAITDVLFGKVNPGGRVPISVPYSVGTLPSFYSFVLPFGMFIPFRHTRGADIYSRYKNTAHPPLYVDANWWPTVTLHFPSLLNRIHTHNSDNPTVFIRLRTLVHDLQKHSLQCLLNRQQQQWQQQ